jgi:hypothetical protein
MLYGPQLPGTGEHNIKGSFADIAQGLRSEESTYKAVLRGAREGVIEAFQWLKRLQEGGGIVSAAYHPGEGLGGLAGAGGGFGGAGGGSSPTDDGSAPLGRAHADQLPILGAMCEKPRRRFGRKLAVASPRPIRPATARAA